MHGCDVCGCAVDPILAVIIEDLTYYTAPTATPSINLPSAFSLTHLLSPPHPLTRPSWRPCSSTWQRFAPTL